MNIAPLFEIQKKLVDHIDEKHPRKEGDERFEKKVLALQVEIGELANEWRGFKFWSEDQEPREYRPNPSNPCEVCHGQAVFMEEDSISEFCQHCDGVGFHYHNPLLEEYVDGLHFILDLGIENKYNTPVIMEWLNSIGYGHYGCETITQQFAEVFNAISKFNFEPILDHYEEVFFSYLTLGYMLGFTWSDIEGAYLEKNKVNHERQLNGY